MGKKVKNAAEACVIFNEKFEKLVGKTEGQFKKKSIDVLGAGEGIVAYILKEQETMYVVPFNKDLSPSIEKLSNVRIRKEIKTVKEAKNAFIAEYGSVVQMINAASMAYDGYVFKKETITIRTGSAFEAFIAHDTDKKLYLIVPSDGAIPKIENYDDVKVIK